MKLALVGDVMLGRLVNQALRRKAPVFPWGDTLPILESADWRACNLECVISDRKPSILPGKVFHFRSDARNIAVLTAARIDAVSLANNHTLDYGEEALADMLELLDQAGVGHSGAGRNFAEAMRPAVSRVGGLRIGMLACTDNEPGWAARPASAGLFYVPAGAADERTGPLLESVRRARSQVDLLIVSLHWGPNWGTAPPPTHVRLAKRLIEAGADVVFGHSGHVVRAIEIYRGKPIIYCAGNFIDDYAVDEIERNDQSFIFVLEIEQERIARVRLYPTVIDGFHASIAHGREADDILDRMRRLCERFGSCLKVDAAVGVLPITEPVPQEVAHG
jgi:poly-gamma-glutamate capsule biosynthesis protein CapA/YwtB (metallophosphatase superfamily)